MYNMTSRAPLHIGFISTRFSGTDGVTLEARKWAEVLGRMGHRCYWYAGRTDFLGHPGTEDPLAFFQHPEVLALQDLMFGRIEKAPWLGDAIASVRRRLAQSVSGFLRKFEIDVAVIQNAWAVPMHVPLGLAIADAVRAEGCAAIAHHHDFGWERERFRVHCIPEHLEAAFPPRLEGIRHAVIHTGQRETLQERCGLDAVVVPNVADFAVPSSHKDEFNADLRDRIGIGPDDLFVLQPTRVVRRKGIEHSIELVRRLADLRAKLVVSHAVGDEGRAYFEWLLDVARDKNVEVIWAADWIGETREANQAGGKRYALSDVYAQADFVTYPSLWEGFGNALIEAVHQRKPILVNAYEVFVRDIEPRGFKVVRMEGAITDAVEAEVRRVLANPALRREMVDQNHAAAARAFSFEVLEEKLRLLLDGIRPGNRA